MITRLNNAPRFYVYVVLTFGFLISFSCQAPPLSVDVETVRDKDEGSIPPGGLKSLSDREILEIRMQWASFITARVLCRDTEAREEAAAYLAAQNTDVVNIDDFIVSTDHTPRFRELFIDQVDSLILFIDGTGKPSHNQPIPPSSRQGAIQDASDYIYILTVRNCLQLFFPNGISEVGNGVCYSTAHPLTLASENYGYELYCDEVGFGAGMWGSTEVTIGNPIVKEGRELVVTRPYRSLVPAECNYIEYNHIDFTQFLN